MRDYGKAKWTDFNGAIWPVIKSCRRLKFSYPSHAALRAHVFHADGYKCRRCDACALHVPVGYSGAETLATNYSRHGWPVLLVVDHILTLRAGGLNVIENFQTLCETCNRKKQKEDKAAIADYLARGSQ